MKKYLIAIAMVLSLSMNAEAYSDTTNAEAEDAEDDQYITYRQGTTYSSSDARELKEVMDVVGGGMIPSMITGVVVITIIFLLAPLVIIITIFYFVNKNRRERYKLAQMAMQNGQPIPDELLKEQTRSMESSDYQSGVRQMFTGVGLAIFLGIIIGKIGIGIGALVFFIGLGKWFIARQDRQDRNDFMNRQNYNSSNQSNIQDYE